MSEKQFKKTSVIVAVALAGLFILVPFAAVLCWNSPIEASTTESAEPWECPINKNLSERDCEIIMEINPGYLTEEASSIGDPPRKDGMIVGLLGFPICSLNGSLRRVECQGSKVSDTFYIGKHQNKFTVCINNVNFYQYETDEFDYVYITSAGGADTIEVVQPGDSRTCYYGGTRQITVGAFDSNWTQYLNAKGSFGNDTIIGTPNHDWLYGEDDSDTIKGMDGNDYIYGGNGADNLHAGDGIDQLKGGEGNDILSAFMYPGLPDSYGFDYMYGEGGSDTYYACIDGCLMCEYDTDSDGNDFFEFYGGGENSYVWVFGDNGDDYIEGSNYDDYIVGRDGDDTIYGREGNDTIHGEEGYDQIIGEGGNDSIYGGEDTDCIVGDYEIVDVENEDGDDYIEAGEGGDADYDCVYCDSVNLDDSICGAEGYSINGGDDEAYQCLGECAYEYYSCRTSGPGNCEMVN
jgi:Ca2+-binding RTX toxin-like protein